jgi:hypothetical protein
MPPKIITAAPRRSPRRSGRVAAAISAPNSSGPPKPPTIGAGRVEERDRHRPGLHREDLRDRQVRGAAPGRREEEDDAPGDRLCRRVERPVLNRQAGDDQQDPGQDVGARDHRLAADRVEEAPEQQRAEEVADRDGIRYQADAPAFTP